MANAHLYGFRWSYSTIGAEMPQVEYHPIASAYSPSNGAITCNLNIGDPVLFVDGGTLQLTPPGNADTTNDLVEATYGIVVGFPRVKIAGAVRPNGFLTAGTTYTGSIGGQEATVCAVIPVMGQVFECDISATAPGASFDTIEEYLALGGKQVDITYSGLTSGIGQPKANPLVATAANSTTGFRQLRVINVSRIGDDQDYTSGSVRLQVMFNQIQLAWTPTIADI